MVRHLLLALILFAAVGCSSDGETPETACASASPGESVNECKDFGEGEGPLGD